MEIMKDIEGVVLFANAYTAVVLKGTWDEDGFYPEGLIDVHFFPNKVENERLHPGDWIETKLFVKKNDSEENPEKYFKEMLKWKEEYIEPDDERYGRFNFWIKQGQEYEKQVKNALKLPCFGELNYSDKEWKAKAKVEKYHCQVLSGCAVSEECAKAKVVN